MRKLLSVAVREFTTTVMTRAFLLGVLLPPLIGGVMVTLMPILMNQAAPQVAGRIALIDQSGLVAEQLQGAFTPDRMDARRKGKMEKVFGKASQKVPGIIPPNAAEQAAAAMGSQTQLTLELLPADSDVEAAKKHITLESIKDGAGANPRLVVVVIPKSAVEPEPGQAATGYQVFVAPKLDAEVEDDIEEQIAKAIIDARLTVNSYNVAKVRGLLERPQAQAKTVTAEGERQTNGAAAMLVPGAFMILLWISVFTAGQYLLMTTIEEKSNRVMEVLLSAVSPLELMVGKIIGQMAVGSVILCSYAGVGLAGLAFASLMHLVDPLNLVYLGVYFLIAFFIVASMMAAIGSAVSDIREAQSLMMPMMMVLIIPMMLWFPIMRHPNSVFAQVCSFLPPVSPFVMVLRLAGPEPVPVWQVPVSILLGIGYAAGAAWAAAKVFRVGALLYGKPPNFRTLIKWVRMA